MIKIFITLIVIVISGWSNMVIGKEVIISPDISGRILKSGKPLIGIPVTRYTYYEEEQNDIVTTDDAGYFKFSQISKKSKRPLNPFDETRIQTIIYLNNTLDENNSIYIQSKSYIGEIPDLNSILDHIEFDLDEKLIAYGFVDKEKKIKFSLSARSELTGYQERLD